MAKKQSKILEFPDKYSILAADLSLKRPGFCIIEVNNKQIAKYNYWSVDNKKDTKKKHPQLLLEIAQSLYEHIFDAEIDAPLYWVREAALPKSVGAMSTMSLNEVVGMTNYILAIEGHGDKEWLELWPITIKKTLTGNAKADKDEVAKAVVQYVGDTNFKNDDESDACAVGIAWLIQQGEIACFTEQKQNSQPQ